MEFDLDVCNKFSNFADAGAGPKARTPEQTMLRDERRNGLFWCHSLWGCPGRNSKLIISLCRTDITNELGGMTIIPVLYI